MDGEALQKIVSMLDVLAVGVAEHRKETAEHRCEFTEFRGETRASFERVERRLGRVETRLETIEDDFRAFRAERDRG